MKKRKGGHTANTSSSCVAHATRLGPCLRAAPWQLRCSGAPERALWAPNPPGSGVGPTPSLLASCEPHPPSAGLPDSQDRLRGPQHQESCRLRVAMRHPHEEGPFWVPSASIMNTVSKQTMEMYRKINYPNDAWCRLAHGSLSFTNTISK